MGELAKIESFKREIALAETWEDWKNLTIKGDLLADLAKKSGIATDGQNELGRTRIGLEELKGKYLNDNFKHGGTGANQYKSAEVRELDLCKMENEGISKTESSRARLITNEVDLCEKVMDEIEERKDIITPYKVASEIKKKKKQEDIVRQKEDIKNSAINSYDGLYDIIIIDPPWQYGRKYDPESSRVASPYPEMSYKELTTIEIPSKDSCILWLWTTHAFIFEAKDLMNVWGFNYKGILVWDKEKMGMGHWLRMQCEFCLLGIKGNPIWDAKNIRDIIRDSRREHSRKPELFYNIIDDNFVGRKLDYFSREEKEGYDQIGNDLNKF